MSLYLNKTVGELLGLPKRELLSFLIDEAKCSENNIKSLLSKPKRETLEFLISRLRGRAVNLDYEMLLDVLSKDQGFLDSVTVTLIKTMGVNFEVEIQKENVLAIEVVRGDLTLNVKKRNLTLEVLKE